MTLQFKSKEKIPDSIGLLVSMLVRYPAISSINYDQNIKLIKLTFLLYNNKNNIKNYVKHLKKALNVFWKFEKNDKKNIELKYNKIGNMTLLNIYCQIENLTQMEVDLTYELTCEYFFDALLIEMDELNLDDKLFQEIIFDDILENIKIENINQSLVAFRDKGKVLVYNK